MVKSKTNFEKDFERLEEISETLESEKVTLEESIKLYEEGVILSKRLLEILTKSELKINQLKTELDGSFSKNKLEIETEE